MPNAAAADARARRLAGSGSGPDVPLTGNTLAHEDDALQLLHIMEEQNQHLREELLDSRLTIETLSSQMVDEEQRVSGLVECNYLLAQQLQQLQEQQLLWLGPHQLHDQQQQQQQPFRSDLGSSLPPSLSLVQLAESEAAAQAATQALLSSEAAAAGAAPFCTGTPTLAATAVETYNEPLLSPAWAASTGTNSSSKTSNGVLQKNSVHVDPELQNSSSIDRLGGSSHEQAAASTAATAAAAARGIYSMQEPSSSWQQQQEQAQARPDQQQQHQAEGRDVNPSLIPPLPQLSLPPKTLRRGAMTPGRSSLDILREDSASVCDSIPSPHPSLNGSPERGSLALLSTRSNASNRSMVLISARSTTSAVSNGGLKDLANDLLLLQSVASSSAVAAAGAAAMPAGGTGVTLADATFGGSEAKDLLLSCELGPGEAAGLAAAAAASIHSHPVKFPSGVSTPASRKDSLLGTPTATPVSAAAGGDSVLGTATATASQGLGLPQLKLPAMILNRLRGLGGVAVMPAGTSADGATAAAAALPSPVTPAPATAATAASGTTASSTPSPPATAAAEAGEGGPVSNSSSSSGSGGGGDVRRSRPAEVMAGGGRVGTLAAIAAAAGAAAAAAAAATAVIAREHVEPATRLEAEVECESSAEMVHYNAGEQAAAVAGAGAAYATGVGVEGGNIMQGSSAGEGAASGNGGWEGLVTLAPLPQLRLPATVKSLTGKPLEREEPWTPQSAAIATGGGVGVRGNCVTGQQQQQGLGALPQLRLPARVKGLTGRPISSASREELSSPGSDCSQESESAYFRGDQIVAVELDGEDLENGRFMEGEHADAGSYGVGESLGVSLGRREGEEEAGLKVEGLGTEGLGGLDSFRSLEHQLELAKDALEEYLASPENPRSGGGRAAAAAAAAVGAGEGGDGGVVSPSERLPSFDACFGSRSSSFSNAVRQPPRDVSAAVSAVNGDDDGFRDSVQQQQQQQASPGGQLGGLLNLAPFEDVSLQGHQGVTSSPVSPVRLTPSAATAAAGAGADGVGLAVADHTRLAIMSPTVAPGAQWHSGDTRVLSRSKSCQSSQRPGCNNCSSSSTCLPQGPALTRSISHTMTSPLKPPLGSGLPGGVYLTGVSVAGPVGAMGPWMQPVQYPNGAIVTALSAAGTGGIAGGAGYCSAAGAACTAGGGMPLPPAPPSLGATAAAATVGAVGAGALPLEAFHRHLRVVVHPAPLGSSYEPPSGVNLPGAVTTPMRVNSSNNLRCGIPPSPGSQCATRYVPASPRIVGFECNTPGSLRSPSWRSDVGGGNDVGVNPVGGVPGGGSGCSTPRRQPPSPGLLAQVLGRSQGGMYGSGSLAGSGASTPRTARHVRNASGSVTFGSNSNSYSNLVALAGGPAAAALLSPGAGGGGGGPGFVTPRAAAGGGCSGAPGFVTPRAAAGGGGGGPAFRSTVPDTATLLNHSSLLASGLLPSASPMSGSSRLHRGRGRGEELLQQEQQQPLRVELQSQREVLHVGGFSVKQGNEVPKDGAVQQEEKQQEEEEVEDREREDVGHEEVELHRERQHQQQAVGNGAAPAAIEEGSTGTATAVSNASDSQAEVAAPGAGEGGGEEAYVPAAAAAACSGGFGVVLLSSSISGSSGSAGDLVLAALGEAEGKLGRGGYEGANGGSRSHWSSSRLSNSSNRNGSQGLNPSGEGGDGTAIGGAGVVKEELTAEAAAAGVGGEEVAAAAALRDQEHGMGQQGGGEVAGLDAADAGGANGVDLLGRLEGKEQSPASAAPSAAAAVPAAAGGGGGGGARRLGPRLSRLAVMVHADVAVEVARDVQHHQEQLLLPRQSQGQQQQEEDAVAPGVAAGVIIDPLKTTVAAVAGEPSEGAAVAGFTCPGPEVNPGLGCKDDSTIHAAAADAVANGKVCSPCTIPLAAAASAAAGCSFTSPVGRESSSSSTSSSSRGGGGLKQLQSVGGVSSSGSGSFAVTDGGSPHAPVMNKMLNGVHTVVSGSGRRKGANYVPAYMTR